MARTAWADDDDKKLRSKQPAFQGPVMRFPDAWKIANAAPRVPSAGDATFPSKNVQLKSWIPLNNFAGFSAGDNGAGFWGRLASAALMLVLVAGLVAIDVVQDNDRATEVAELDAALLTDDLPPEAYADPGFLQFIKSDLGRTSSTLSQ